MYAVEFETVVNKPYIEIPEYERFKGQEVKVILLGENDTKQTDNSIDNFMYFIDNLSVEFPKDFKFDREEVYDR